MSAEPSSVSTLASLRPSPQSHLPSTTIGFDTSAGFELIMRGAKLLASSSLVPQNFQGNLPNCVIALNMAHRIGADPLLVMQSLFVVHGRPGWSAKFLIASFNQCGRFSALRYRWEGEKGKDSWGCRAWATEKSTGETIEGPLITIALAKSEKWYERAGSKWQTIPELMLCYRAAAWMINTHAPEISMGLNTAEELGDTFTAQATPEGGYEVTTESLREVRDAAVPPVADEAPREARKQRKAQTVESPRDEEAATLLAIDNAGDGEVAAEILDRVRGEPFYARAAEAFKARWVTAQ